MEIIPAIDIIDGKCVRLSQGDYAQKKEYSAQPVEIAKAYEDAGIRRLHLVDLDGAKQKKVVNLPVLEKIAAGTKLLIDFGGGVQSDEDIELVYNAGAQQVTAGSIAVKNPELVEQWLQKYGSEKLILGADVKGEKIAISGWAEESDHDLIPFLQTYRQKGFQYVVCTDVSKDGMLQGPAFALYEKIQNALPDMKVIASGGVSQLADLHVLQDAGVYGVIIGKAIYEGKIELKDLQEFL
jgi:phosphoribosylformimino-5-aminoimidazole carboxamide ribotide isomerase